MALAEGRYYADAAEFARLVREAGEIIFGLDDVARLVANVIFLVDQVAGNVAAPAQSFRRRRDRSITAGESVGTRSMYCVSS